MCAHQCASAGIGSERTVCPGGVCTHCCRCVRQWGFYQLHLLQDRSCVEFSESTCTLSLDPVGLLASDSETEH